MSLEAIKYKGVLIAADQSLANTGLVVLEFPDVKILQRMTLKSSTSVDGTEKCLLRAEELVGEYNEWLCQQIGLYSPELVIHELPGASNRLARPESSLLAALALRTVCNELGLPVKAISANVAKRVFTGNGNAQKRHVREALYGFFPHFAQAKLNEHLCDAISLGVTYAIKYAE